MQPAVSRRVVGEGHVRRTVERHLHVTTDGHTIGRRRTEAEAHIPDAGATMRLGVDQPAGARIEVERLHPAVGAVCPSCGARIGKPCVSTIPTFGVGAVGVPIEGVHAERVAAAREQGVA